MTPLRILVLFGNVPLLGNERANIETLDQLRHQGATVRFLIRRKWTVRSIQAELHRRNLEFRFAPYFDTVRYDAGIHAWIRNLFGICGGSLALLWQIYSFKPTHLHVGSTAWVLNFLPVLLLTRLPLVFRAGEMPAQHHALWRWVWRFTCHRASAFVCDSHFLKREIIAMGAPADRCHVAYAPAPRRPFATVSLAEKISPPPLVILFVGQISAQKGVDILINVAEKLIHKFPMKLLIAGDYSWNNPLGQVLVKRVQESELTSQIEFAGYVEDIEPLYASAHLHVAPSVSTEAYGLTVIEAKAHCVPSIVFPTGGLLELIEHDLDGWVCEEPSAASLETALKHYLENPHKLSEQGGAAFRSLTERLRVQDYGKCWASIYTKCNLRGCGVEL